MITGKDLLKPASAGDARSKPPPPPPPLPPGFGITETGGRWPPDEESGASRLGAVKPFVITGLAIVAIAIPAEAWIDSADMGPWGALGVATLGGLLASFVGVLAFGERVWPRRHH